MRLQAEEAYFKAWGKARDTLQKAIQQFKAGDFTAKNAAKSFGDPNDQIIELKKEIQRLIRDLEDHQRQNGKQEADFQQEISVMRRQLL